MTPTCLNAVASDFSQPGKLAGLGSLQLDEVVSELWNATHKMKNTV